jgi:hypothetical protein
MSAAWTRDETSHQLPLVQSSVESSMNLDIDPSPAMSSSRGLRHLEPGDTNNLSNLQSLPLLGESFGSDHLDSYVQQPALRRLRQRSSEYMQVILDITRDTHELESTMLELQANGIVQTNPSLKAQVEKAIRLVSRILQSGDRV